MVIAGLAAGSRELGEHLGQVVAVVGWHPAKNVGDRGAAAVHDGVEDSPARCGQGQCEMPPVMGVFPTVQQAVGDEAVACSGGVRRVHPHRIGQCAQVDRAAAGDDHQRPELDHCQGILDSGDRLCADTDQHPGGRQHCIHLLIEMPLFPGRFRFPCHARSLRQALGIGNHTHRAIRKARV